VIPEVPFAAQLLSAGLIEVIGEFEDMMHEEGKEHLLVLQQVFAGFRELLDVDGEEAIVDNEGLFSGRARQMSWVFSFVLGCTLFPRPSSITQDMKFFELKIVALHETRCCLVA
jgi:hypothetical protein